MGKIIFSASAKKNLKYLSIATVITLAVILFIQFRRPITANKLADSDAPQIAFVSDGEMYVYDQAAKAVIQLTQSDGSIRDAAWSPDGRYLALLFYKSEFQKEPIDTLYRLDLSSGKLLPLTPTLTTQAGV